MLTNLRLYQFKRFKDEEIELFPLTLLTGVNGKGKSTIIQALIILRQSFDRGELQNNHKIVIEDSELVNLVSPDAILSSAANSVEVGISLKDSEENSISWVFKAEGKSNILPVKADAAFGNIYNSCLFDETFQYLNAERIGPRLSYEKLTRTRPHSPLGYRGEYTADRILNALNGLEKTQLTIFNKKTNSVYELLSYWVSEIIYPGTTINVNASGASQIDLNYSFKDDDTKVHNPLNVGFGFSYALPVILAVLTAKPGSLLIVENPEAHLHPTGQSRMGILLALAAEGGVQVIVETHSDHVLNGIRVLAKGKSKYGKFRVDIVRAYFFHKAEAVGEQIANKQAISILDNGKLSGWPAGFFDEWENNLMEIIG
jgi:predicted ATPase